VRTDASGGYTVCGVPASVGLRVVGSKDSVSSGVLDLGPRDARVLRRDLLLGFPDSTRRGAIGGTVRGSAGEPVTGARVLSDGVAEARSGADGRFLLRGVLPGTRQIEVLAIGTLPAAAIVDVAPLETSEIEVQLAKVTTLDTMRIAAPGVRRRLVRDIEERKKEGYGHYMDSIQVEKHADFRSAVSELPFSRCLSHLWIDGQEVKPRDIAFELKLLKPNEIGVLEWYNRGGAPMRFNNQSCVLIVWTRRALPH